MRLSNVVSLLSTIVYVYRSREIIETENSTDRSATGRCQQETIFADSGNRLNVVTQSKLIRIGEQERLLRNISILMLGEELLQ